MIQFCEARDGLIRCELLFGHKGPHIATAGTGFKVYYRWGGEGGVPAKLKCGV